MARIELDSAAIRAFLQSEDVRKEVARRSQNVADAAGGEAAGFEPFEFMGKDRWHGGVHAVDYDAVRDEAENRTLSKAIDAARD